MKKIALLVLILFILSALQAVSQNQKITSDDKKLLETANTFYKQGNYVRALAIFKSLADTYTSNADLQYKTGICYLYKPDEKENAITYITTAANLNPKLEDLNFNLGRAYHINYKFKEAIGYFESYIKTNPTILKKNQAEHYLEFCKNGEVVAGGKNGMIIENLGPPVNTDHSEYVPVVSADESVMIFTYKGEKSTGGLMDEDLVKSPEGQYYEDIFVSYKIGEKWTEPQSIGENINTKGHDASIALSADGQKLFIFKSTPADKGDIYMSQLEGEVWSKPVKFNSNINTKYWEGSMSLSANESTIYFVSERPGGLGGRDIYKSEKQPNGDWGPAINLGDKVNTKFDDDAPFFHPDGKTLFFSSKGHNSIGGYDIFYTVLNENMWSEPVNMGSPVNTTDDDIYYVLTPDGETGYYSSNRKEGYGDQDIYVITPGLKGERPVLALAVGEVYLDSKPVAATIKVMNADNGAVYGNYKANSATGKYMVTLPPGVNYKLSVQVQGQPEYIEMLDVKGLQSYALLNQDMQLFTPQYMKENNISEMPVNVLQKSLTEQIKIYEQEASPDVYEARMYKDLLKKNGDIKKDSVTYSVDLGTYENAKDIDVKLLSNIANIKEIKNSDGTTSLYSTGYSSMIEAEATRQQLISKNADLATASTVKVNDRGVEKTIPQYYENYYNRKGYVHNATPKVVKAKTDSATLELQAINKLVDDYGTVELKGVTYKVELSPLEKPIDAVELKKIAKYGKVETQKNKEGKIVYSISNFKTLKAANDFKLSLKEKEAIQIPTKIAAKSSDKTIEVKDFFADANTVEKINAVNSKTTATAKVSASNTKPVKKTITSAVTSTSQQQAQQTQKASNENESIPCEQNKNIDFAFFADKDLNDVNIYNKLIATASNMCVNGLTFNVQVGAYKFPNNFKYNFLAPVGCPIVIDNEQGDGLARFTVCEIKTLTEAENVRKKAKKLGVSDSWITAKYNGKRMLLTDLIKVNFYNKAVN